MAEVKTAELLVPPAKRDGAHAAMDDGRPSAALVVTHDARRDRFGRKIEVRPSGFALGGSGSDFEVEGAERSGTHLGIEWVGGEAEGQSEWSATAVGQVTINGVPP